MNRFLTTVAVFILTGCVSIDPDLTRNMLRDAKNISGTVKSLRSSNIRSPRALSYKARQIGSIVRTVQKYRRLTTPERERVYRAVRYRYDHNVSREKTALAKKYKTRKKTIRRERRQQVAAAQTPAAVSRAKKEEAQELATIDENWQAEAQRNAERKYGTDFAVPIENSEGRNVVAFASVRDGNVQTSDSAYILDSTPGDRTIAHQNKTYTYLDGR